jgi:RadC-like JAB domain
MAKRSLVARIASGGARFQKCLQRQFYHFLRRSRLRWGYTHHFTRPLDRLTRAVSSAATTMQIQFFDHLIMGTPAEGRAGYFSFKEAGLL